MRAAENVTERATEGRSQNCIMRDVIQHTRHLVFYYECYRIINDEKGGREYVGYVREMRNIHTMLVGRHDVARH